MRSSICTTYLTLSHLTFLFTLPYFTLPSWYLTPAFYLPYLPELDTEQAPDSETTEVTLTLEEKKGV